MIGRFILRKLQKFLFIGSLVLLWMGGSNIWHALRHGTPTIVSLSDDARDELPAHLTLREVSFWPTSAVSFGSREVYIPLRSRTAQASGAIRVLLKSSDEEFIALATRTPNAGEEMKWLAANAGAIAAQLGRREVTGSLEGWLDLRDSRRRALRKAMPALREDFVVVAEGQSPGVLKGVVLLAGAFGLFVLLGLSASDPKPAAGSSLPPPFPGRPPHPSSDRSLPPPFPTALPPPPPPPAGQVRGSSFQRPTPLR